MAKSFLDCPFNTLPGLLMLLKEEASLSWPTCALPPTKSRQTVGPTEIHLILQKHSLFLLNTMGRVHLKIQSKDSTSVGNRT